MNYEHDQLRQYLEKLSNCPNDVAGFEKWIQASEQLDFLRQNALEKELIVCARAQHAFIQTAIVEEDRVSTINKDDLLRWADLGHSSASYNHDSERDEFWIQRDDGFMSSKTLENARRLVYIRSLEDSYPEVLQEYLHVSGIHWVPDKSAYCRYNELGDLEAVVSLTAQRSEGELCFASFSRESLELYLAASNSIAIRLFDFTLFRISEFRGWSNKEINIFDEGDEMFYQQSIEPGNGSYTKGIQIIRPKRTREQIFATLKQQWYGHSDQWVDFVARDYRSGCVMTISTDPSMTTYRGDTESSLPWELSPAFFRAEVLLKYKADPDKYTVRTRRIDCRHLWGINYDVNKAGQIHAYICDLRQIPYEEQQYWASFNEEPKGDISSRAFEQDFLAQWSNLDPVDEIVALCRRWASSDLKFWKLGEEALLDRVSTPNTKSRDEWAEAFLGLWKLLIEGFRTKVIRARMKERDIPFEESERSIALLERLIGKVEGLDEPERLEGLRRINEIRTKAKAHSTGGEGRKIADEALETHGTYAAHFNHVCEIVLEELKRIEQAFSSRTAGHQGLES